jgi:hypothetical protein
VKKTRIEYGDHTEKYHPWQKMLSQAIDSEDVAIGACVGLEEEGMLKDPWARINVRSSGVASWYTSSAV